MTFKNCSQCKYPKNGLCAVNPVHHSAWNNLQNLDDLTKNSVKINDSKLDECPSFEAQLTQNNPNLQKTDTTGIFMILLLIFSLISSGFVSYQIVSRLPIYKNYNFPYNLSKETRLAISVCSTVHKSLESEVTHIGKSRKLSQLDSCLEKTPLYPHYQKTVPKMQKDYQLADEQLQKLDIQKLNNDYNSLLQELDTIYNGIPSLEWYRVVFGVLFIVITLFLSCILSLSFIELYIRISLRSEK